MRYIALYCRLSPRPDGTYEGVEDQEKWGRDYAASAWPGMAVRVFADKGISAAGDDHRPGYEALRQAVQRGEVAHLWAVEQTRLERREVEWFRLAAELDAAGVTELHTNRDGVVRVRDEVAGIKAVLAAGEVRKLKRRVNDRLDEIAANGRPAGGTVYGYRRGVDETGGKTLLIDDDQAAVLREIAERLLAGWSLARVAADLNDRGVRGNLGGRITTSAVKAMISNHTIAGYRVHRGRVVGRGVWSPILDEETWAAVRDRLATPRTVARSDGGTYPISTAARTTARRYLLTGGTAVCGVCDSPLVAAMKHLRNRQPKPYYLCHPTAGGRACIGIMGDPLEEYVVRRLLDELDKPTFRAALAVDEYADRRDALTTALRALERRRNDLAEAWATGDITVDEWQTARRTLAEREQQLRADLAAVPAPVSNVDVSLIREGWGAMNLDERREIVGMFIERVIVKRAVPGTRSFDENRVGESGVVWRQR